MDDPQYIERRSSRDATRACSRSEIHLTNYDLDTIICVVCIICDVMQTKNSCFSVWSVVYMAKLGLNIRFFKIVRLIFELPRTKTQN